MTPPPSAMAPKPLPEPLPEPLGGFPSISNWIAVQDGRTVLVRTGRVEIGQGNATALAQIAADELDLSLDQVTLLSGDTNETPDEGATTGSRSMSVGGASLRLAASAARSVLVAEAARLLQADPADLSVESGVIHRDGEATALDYWSLAGTVDLTLPVVDHARPKPPTARRLTGMSVPRVDLPRKIGLSDGVPAFVHDMAPDGLLHGRVVHPPRLGDRLAEVDDPEAVIAAHNLITVMQNGSFIGVLAMREEDAVAGAAALAARCTWDGGVDGPADPIARIRAALDDGSHPVEIMAETGDTGSAPGTRHETTVSRPYLCHASIGPSAAVALADDDGFTVWSHTQGPHMLRNAICKAFDVSLDRVRVIHAHGAGCYGHNGADDVALDAVLMSFGLPGMPVKVVRSRADELGTSPLGTAQVSRASATVEAGRITGMSVEIASQPFVNRPSRLDHANLLSALRMDPPQPGLANADVPEGADRNGVPYYAIPNVRVTKTIVKDLPYRTSSLRGLGAYGNVFAIETLIDDIAHDLGVDPVAFRLDHLEDERARRVISRCAELCGWPGKSGGGSGLGLAFARYKNVAGYCAVAAEVAAEAEVRVTRLWAVADCGEAINPDGIANQIEGGIIQATSWTLKEAATLEAGTVTSRDWAGYPILTFSETPETVVEVIHHPDQTPLGAGEASMGPTAAAIGNALRNALGVRVRDLPLTRERVAAAVG